MPISTAEFLAMEARIRAGRKTVRLGFSDLAAPESESKLHQQILAECDKRLWGYVHSRMDRRTTNRKGVCDFVIIADGGRTFLIECKRPKAKFSQDQLSFEAVAKRNGHHVHRVETFEEFLRIVG